ncbi:MAG TPA: hypothetical protein ENN09_02555 [Planctomycetes bacterium]|nr:hypothetical protein [Planctomycetota bacterium]
MRNKVIAALIALAAIISLALALKYGGNDAGSASSEQPAPHRIPAETTYRDAALDAIKTGVEYLMNTQRETGAWGTFQPSVGITGLVVHAMLISPLGMNPANTPAIRKGLDFIASSARENGEINDPDGYANYNTSIAIMALAASGDPKYETLIKKGQAFIMGQQYAENLGVTSDNPIYGGIGYGSDKSRPDMSNTQWAIEALSETGLSKDDPAFRKALFFLHRCQNLSEVNDLEYAAVVNDGGGLYTSQPDAKDISKAGQVTVRGKVGWRSYGSMTYAMLKSYLYLGLDKNSPEVKGALDWISNNWTVAENPGMANPMQGYYYYLATFAKTFDVLGQQVVVDAEGKEHNWADEIIARVLSLRQPDGSWANSADRWMEGDPAIVTAYVVRSLSFAYKAASDRMIGE